MPPGILYGRFTCGWLYRSLIRAGKITMYDIVVNVRTTPIITLNVAAALPFAIFVAAMNTIVEITPDRKLTLTGVPSFAEKRPRTAGRRRRSRPPPGCGRSPSAMCRRSRSSAMMNPNAAIFVITLGGAAVDREDRPRPTS